MACALVHPLLSKNVIASLALPVADTPGPLYSGIAPPPPPLGLVAINAAPAATAAPATARPVPELIPSTDFDCFIL